MQAKEGTWDIPEDNRSTACVDKPSEQPGTTGKLLALSPNETDRHHDDVAGGLHQHDILL